MQQQQQKQQKQRLIFYVHGWGSNGKSQKGEILEQYFGTQFIYCPSLPVNAELAIHLLEQNIKLMNNHYDITLVGSSLGGYYSLYLSQKYGLKAVLINPCLEPHNIIKLFLGENKNSDGSTYTLIQDQIDSYAQFKVENLQQSKENILVLLKKGDELIDYKIAQKYLSECNLDIEEGGNHLYEDFEVKCEKIDKFSRGLLS